VTTAKRSAPGSKGDQTKKAILDVARRQFHESGYGGATVRSIAAGANIDPAMIIRYFGSKPALFTAAVGVDLQLPDLAAVPKARRGQELAAHFMTRWEGREDYDSLVALLRSAVGNDDARAQLQKVFAHQVKQMVGRIVPRDEADRRSILVTSQLLGLAMARYILAFPEARRMSGSAIVALFGPALQRHLHGPLPTTTAETATSPRRR
jgi:AcrR family transcriptional regulator